MMATQATAAAVPRRSRPRSRSSSRTRRSTSTVRTVDGYEEKEVPPPGCTCYRDYAIVLCTNCGFTHQGRVKTECKVHTRTIYLLDIAQCPQCRAYPPILKEIPNTK